MAKKKKSVELLDKNILFSLKDLTYKVIRYHPASMTVDVMVFEKEVKQGLQKLAFAHLPKEMKKIIKPN